MPVLDLQLNRDLIVRREDIIQTIRTNIVDGEILEDIVENIERQVIARCKDLARVSIPFVGTLVPNEDKLIKVENHELFKSNRETLSKEEYNNFKLRFLEDRYRKRRGFRTRSITINRMIRLNKNHAARMLKKYNNTRNYRMYFYFFAFMTSHTKTEYDYVEYDELKGFRI